MDKKLIEKAQKLFAMANSTSEHEAMIAAQKLQKLRLENNISRLEMRELLDGQKGCESILEGIEEKVLFTTKQKTWWKIHLFMGVCVGNYCEHLLSTRSGNVGHIIIGQPTNQAIADAQLQYLINVCNNLSRSESGRAAKNAFRMGFSKRVQSRLESMVEDTINDANVTLGRTLTGDETSALVKIEEQNKAAIEQFKKEKYPRITSLSCKSRCSDYGAYSRGSDAGSRIGLSARQLGVGRKQLPGG